MRLLASFEVGQWQVYPSYWSAQRCVTAGKSVYALMSGNLMRYDTEDGSVRTYDVLNDLNDTNIAFMDYSQEAKRLILVYEDENIDLLDNNDHVVNIASLMDRNLIGKDATGLVVHGADAYLTTGFGFLHIDLKSGIVRDTYNYKVSISSFCATSTHYWILVKDKTEPAKNGIYNIERDNKNIHLLSAWTRLGTLSNATQLVAMGDKVMASDASGIYRFEGDATVKILPSPYSTMRILPDGRLLLASTSMVQLSEDGSTFTPYELSGPNKDFTMMGSTFWVAQADEGLKSYKLGEGLQPTGECIQPNSPKRDMSYRISLAGDRLLVAGGKNESIWFPPSCEPVAMYMDADGKWTNFDESPATELVPSIPASMQYNTESLVQDPNDPTHHFAGTFRYGLKEYRDGKLIKIYHADNSPLQSAQPSRTDYLKYTTADGIAYDAEGNLWIGNQYTDTIVRFITPDGKWHSLFYPEITPVQYVYQYLFSSSGINFIMAYSDSGVTYLFGFDTNGTLTNGKDDRHKVYTNWVNQDGTAYKPRNLYCAAEDLDGVIWMGTLNGMFVMPDPSRFFDDDFNVEQVKIPRNDGSGLADYLLNGVSVKAIAVDGANRKWVGTQDNGLLLISADGTEQIHHFQTDNSPLLSNNITSLAVHPTTGLVLIGTDKGLCSYQSDATEARPELSDSQILVYPNPVTPEYNGFIRIDGLTANCEVKICSATGQLVWSGTSNGGTCTWNGCNKAGKRVASGVYNVIASTEDAGKAVVARIVVISQ